MVVSPIQTSFAAGEISPSARGRVDSEAYKRGLAYSENWIHRSLGSIFRRSGSRYVGSLLGAARLVDFKTSAGDFVVALTNGALQVFSQATGLRVPIEPNLILNGHFDAALTSWASVGGGSEVVLEQMRLYDNGALGTRQQTFTAVIGQTYRVRYKARSPASSALFVGWSDGGPYNTLTNAALTVAEADYEWTFVATGVNITLRIALFTVGGEVFVDSVRVTRDGSTATSLVAPWASADLAAVQWDYEMVKNRVVLTHPSVSPRVITFDAPATFEVYAAEFVNQPTQWSAGNYPTVVEVGFQGRQWFGGTAREQNTFWGSRSGKSFDFTTGANPDDSVSWIVSTKGPMRWMRGQRVMLVGADRVEHALEGANGGIVAPGSISITDQSAFSSAPAMAQHIGDQVLFVTKDRRHIRAMDFSTEKNQWVTAALTWLAEHLTASPARIQELHFARTPTPTIAVVRQGNSVIACTYDRGLDVLAWYRVTLALGAAVYSACIVEGDDGAEVWLDVVRGGTHMLERIPLHEGSAGYSVYYVDSWLAGVVAADGSVPLVDAGGVASTHLNGLTVDVIVDGAYAGQQVVAGSTVTVDAAFATKLCVAGLPYRSKGITLPPEGGNPRGSSAGSRKRVARIGLILNDSALPLVNGWRAGPDRTPATPMDTPEARMTGKTSTASLGWDEDGQLTIEQDLPFRTEVCAVYGVLATNEV